MKRAAVVLALIVAAAVLAPPAWERFELWRGEREAVKRVEWVLRALAEDDRQTAISQWSRGLIVLPMADLEAEAPAFESFVRGTGLAARGWRVSDAERVAGDVVLVTLRRSDETLTLAVIEGERLRVAG